ncbi:hypothetical protein ERJ75_001740400 [Trypanosoma vivax]|uniref:Uncharacterized protein n=1 Tax=Trypanosoma vivax (strain Y486) TaxID=1055687 RepID=G0U2X0_TRYVY|nr:hypothetical protein TRVL_00896 [Trypanosoma vivax]KAH8604344.1 hypothetical protein ERJ75_001740400 [Trypanosoma vivax]CCC50624.1 conserved hypothetical protein [Trypanosoma vivax Y486]
MAGVGPRLAWRKKLWVHLKAALQALPVSILLVAEGRDLYYRATWEVTEIPPSAFANGDVVAICNRWYTLPTWGHVLYSLVSKILLKSTWDDVGVIWVRDGVPHVCFCDFAGAQVVSLDEFARTRLPRGLALRRLRVETPDASRVPTSSVAALFIEEAKKLKPHPWYIFSASRRCRQEHKYYEYSVDVSRQRQKVYDMTVGRASRHAIGVQKEKLRDMEVVQEHLGTFVDRDEVFRLYNGSLVASFLATFGLLDRDLPPPSRYVPQDFAHDLPFKCLASLDEPVIFFKN